MAQVYIVDSSLVEHLFNEDGTIKNRTDFKRIALRCGDLLPSLDFEVLHNNSEIDYDEEKTSILID